MQCIGTGASVGEGENEEKIPWPYLLLVQILASTSLHIHDNIYLGLTLLLPGRGKFAPLVTLDLLDPVPLASGG